MKAVSELGSVREPVSVRRGRLEGAGFRYLAPRAVFVHNGLKVILTSDFVETCHHDDIERALSERSTEWTIHSAAPLSARSQAMLLREATHRARPVVRAPWVRGALTHAAGHDRH